MERRAIRALSEFSLRGLSPDRRFWDAMAAMARWVAPLQKRSAPVGRVGSVMEGGKRLCTAVGTVVLQHAD